MTSALYQALDGADISADGRHWQVHIESMVSSRGLWVLELALIGQPGYSLKVRVPRLDAVTAQRALDAVEDWLRDSNRSDGETIVIEAPAVDELVNVDLQPRDWDRLDPPRPVVLIVDDVEDHLRLYEMTLEGRFTILKATSGREGLEIAKVQRPHVVLVDIMMPGMDGWEVCARLRSTPATSETPIIILTASASSDVPERARAVGAAAVLTKPYVIERLERTIDSVLAKQAPRA
jgi:CheY-like chemotaxis protein